jgi:O-antigen/teichoic acid export membrane protein
LNNLDRLLIARLLNVKAVGLYNVGYNLANRPNTLLIGALQPAFFAASSRLQHDRGRLRHVYLQVFATIWVLLAPLFVFLSLVSADLVHLLFGLRWTEAGGVVATLFLAMPLFVTWAMSTPVLWNSGRRLYELLLQLPLLVMAVLAFYQFAPIGLHAATLVAAALMASRGVVVGIAACRAVGLSFRDLFPHLLRSTLLSVLAAGSTLLGQQAAARLGGPLVSLVSGSLVALVLMLGLVCTRPEVLGSHAAGTVVRFFPKLRSFLKATNVRRSAGSARGNDG